MLIDHKVIYVKDCVAISIGAKIYRFNSRCDLSEQHKVSIEHYNSWMKKVLEDSEEYISYMVIGEKGIVSSGFLTVAECNLLQILTKDELMIKDIIE